MANKIRSKRDKGTHTQTKLTSGKAPDKTVKSVATGTKALSNPVTPITSPTKIDPASVHSGLSIGSNVSVSSTGDILQVDQGSSGNRGTKRTNPNERTTSPMEVDSPIGDKPPPQEITVPSEPTGTTTNTLTPPPPHRDPQGSCIATK